MTLKKTLACMTLAVVTGTGACAALAQPAVGGYNGFSYGPYFGVSAGQLMYKEDGLGEMSPTIAQFHFGQQFNPFLAIEGRVGTSVNGGSWDGYHVDSQLIYAGYIKGIYPLNPWVAPYGILGLGGVQWHRNYDSDSSNDAALSFGVGVQFSVAGNTALTLEWARLTSGDNIGYHYDADTFTFGVNWRF
jgi:opacity protein-like surface antigen